MKIKRYLTLLRACVIESLQFRLSALVVLAGNLLYLIVVYYLWQAIYASAGTDIVNGMTFSDTLIYLVLATALHNLLEMYIVWDIGRSIQTGEITLKLLRPISYRRLIFWSNAGMIAMSFFLTFLPTFIVVSIVTNGAVPLGINLLYFVISVLMSISINFSMDFFIGTVCLYTESIWGINIMKQVIVLLLSGATIPLAFFPEPFRTIVSYLPFQAIYNAPLSILLNGNPEPKWLLTTLGTQLFWCAAMNLLTKLFWKLSVKKITVNGG